LLDRTRRDAGRPSVAARKAIHIEELDADPNNPFAADEPSGNRWLLTTCIAGLAGAIVIGSALLGFVGNDAGGDQALASVNPADFWQRTGAIIKGNYDGENAEVVALRPYSEVAISYRPDARDPAEKVVVIPARELTGSIAGQYPSVSADVLPYGAGDRTIVLDQSVEIGSLDPTNITTIAKTPPPEPVDAAIVLARNETLSDRLTALGVTVESARALAKAIEPVYPQQLFKAGQRFEVTLDKHQDFYGNDVIFPVRLSFSPGPNEDIVVESDEDGQFTAHIDGAREGTRSRYALEAPQYRARSKIGSSLYATAKDEGVPDYIINEMMRIYAFDVDFQRQVRTGDQFEVFYGNPTTGTSTKRKVLHYASLEFAGGQKTYYRFTTPDDGHTDYYDETGRSATKGLLRTPVSGARLTSGFGMRKHPLLGYSKMHAGVDFGVPQGTPIKAAGSGLVEEAGRGGAYGIMVKIKHEGGYRTLYAHMSRLAEGMRPGIKVNQGQIIGYVGSTGRSTGPHLHYEVRDKERPVNPMKVRVAGGRQLEGKILETFRKHQSKIVAMMKEAPLATQLAQNQ
jgi:murein DD-endopeptidase MepM/ murein hydrolase activator NlpD